MSDPDIGPNQERTLGETPGPSSQMVTAPSQREDLRFISDYGECEEKTVVWEIKNILELVKSLTLERTNDHGITFDMGHTIGTRVTWDFHLGRCLRGCWVIGYLESAVRSKVKIARACYNLTLSVGGKIVAAFGNNNRDNNDNRDRDNDRDNDNRGRDRDNDRDNDNRGRNRDRDTERDNDRDRDLRQPGFQLIPTVVILLEAEGGKIPVEVKLHIKIFKAARAIRVQDQEMTEANANANANTNANRTRNHSHLKKWAIRDFEKLLESGNGGDLALIIPHEADRDINEDEDPYCRMVHKAILIARSPTFARMFANGSSSPTPGSESEREETMTMEEMTPQGLDIFLHFIYTGELLETWLEIPNEFLNAAKKYELGKDVQHYCGRKLLSAVTPSNAIDFLKLAKRHKLSYAVKGICEYISKITKAILHGEVSDADADGDASGSEDAADGRH